MSIRKIDEIVKLGSHPLESHFDIEGKSTEMVTTKRNTELLPYSDYDDKDKELEQDYQLIMDGALDIVDRLRDHIDGGAEAKFLARLAEVAGQQLNIALSAAEKKAKLKDSKDKFEYRKRSGPTNKPGVTNQTIIMDTAQLLRIMSANNGNTSGDDIIDAEIITNTENDNDSQK